MGRHLVTKLVVPMMIVLVFVVAKLAIDAKINGPEWIQPVRLEMVREDEQAMVVMAYQKAQAMGHYFRRGENTLRVFEGYAMAAINNKMKIRGDYQGYFSPRGTSSKLGKSCVGSKVSALPHDPLWGTDAQHAALEKQFVNKPRGASGTMSPTHPCWWQPPNSASTLSSSAFTSQIKLLNMIGLNALLPAFKGNSAVEMLYMGVGNSDAFLSAPWSSDQHALCSYQGIDAWTNQPFTHYNPTKRPWYKAAALSKQYGDVFYNPVDTDASTGNPYIGLSKAIRQGPTANTTSGAGDLWGVVALDLNIGEMKVSMKTVTTRADGSAWSAYGYLVGSDGNVALHKGTGAAIMAVEDAEFGANPSQEKAAFIQSIKPQLMNQTMRETKFQRYTKGG